MRTQCLMGAETHFYKMKRALEMDGSDGCPILGRYHCCVHLKRVEMVYFMRHIFYYN